MKWFEREVLLRDIVEVVTEHLTTGFDLMQCPECYHEFESRIEYLDVDVVALRASIGKAVDDFIHRRGDNLRKSGQGQDGPSSVQPE